MTADDDATVQSLLTQLDRLIPREGHVELITDPSEHEYTLVRANKQGYLRLGVELLKAAYAPVTATDAGRRLVNVDVDYISGFGGDHFSFERREDVWSPLSEVSSNAGGFSEMVGQLIGFGCVGVLLVGVVTVIGWVINALLRLL